MQNFEIKHPLIGSTDDLSSHILSLCHVKDTTEVRDGLVQAVIFIRREHKLKGNRTESIGEMEISIKTFIGKYTGSNFNEIYPLIRELIQLIPKFQIFNIDISELREIAHDFDAEYRYNNIFKSIASDIRTLTHQNLSEKVITKIENFHIFLQSEAPSAMIEGSIIVDATTEAKTTLLQSETFKKLLFLKDKLKIAWSSDGKQMDKVYSQDQFIKVIKQILKDLFTEEIINMPGYLLFIDYFIESLEDIKSFNLGKISIGKIRYYLKIFIEELTKSDISNKGDILFRLITIDTLLEQVAFIYYSNIVNSEKKDITTINYFESLNVLTEIALCTCAVGHTTKHLERFTFLLANILKQMDTRPDRAAHFPAIIDFMNSELEKYFQYIQELYFVNIQTGDNNEKGSMANRVLNNLIREKTTHLLGNIINNLRSYIEKKESEKFREILTALKNKNTFNLQDFIFTFGTDQAKPEKFAESPEFMGGKGYSLVTCSNIIVHNKLSDIKVPRGTGFSTLTWHHIKDNNDRINYFKSELKVIIKDLEKRTERTFGDSNNPLLLLTRSGAVISMPGILDTISHIGLNMDITESWAKKLDEPVRAYHAYINFLLSYAKSLYSINPDVLLKKTGMSYEEIYSSKIKDIENHTVSIMNEIESIINAHIPTEPYDQLFHSSLAVFKSYENELIHAHAVNYNIPEEFQTACLIQKCLPVLNSHDCSGVMFTRNPAAEMKDKQFQEHIEYRSGYFGHVIADGTIKPYDTENFIKTYPEQYESLKKFKYFDEREQRYPTDIEFAIRDKVVHIVQSRILKQSPAAQILNSYNFYTEGIYSPFKLIKRTSFSFNKEIIGSYIDNKAATKSQVVSHGRPVNGGAVTGRIIKDPKKMTLYKDKLIYITESNVPPAVIIKEKEIAGYISKEGGITSHAALVAISERKPCVTDANWKPGEHEDEIVLGYSTVKEGDFVTLDANTGNIYLGIVPIVTTTIENDEFKTVQSKILEVIDGLVADSE